MKYILMMLMCCFFYKTEAMTLAEFNQSLSDIPEYDRFIGLTSKGEFKQALDYVESKIQETDQIYAALEAAGLPSEWEAVRDENNKQKLDKKNEIQEAVAQQQDLTVVKKLQEELEQLAFGRYFLAKRYCPEAYYYYGWMTLKPDATLRKKVFDMTLTQAAAILGEIPKIETLEGDFPEQFMRRGSELVCKLYDISAAVCFSKDEGFRDAIAEAQNDIAQFNTVALRKNDFNASGMFHYFSKEINESPARGLISYEKWLIKFFQSSSFENKEQLISIHQTAINMLQPKIDGQFTKLYPGAMLYNFLVTGEILAESLFPKAIKLFEDTLKWDLPTGIDGDEQIQEESNTVSFSRYADLRLTFSDIILDDHLLLDISPALDRISALIDVTKIETTEFTFPPELINEGYNLVRQLYDLAATQFFSNKQNLSEFLRNIGEFKKAKLEQGILLDSLNVFFSFSQDIAQSPVQGLNNYKDWIKRTIQDPSCGNKELLIEGHQLFIHHLQEKIDEKLKSLLHSHKRLHKFFMGKEIFQENKFPDFVKQLEKSLGWDLSTGVDFSSTAAEL